MAEREKINIRIRSEIENERCVYRDVDGKLGQFLKTLYDYRKLENFSRLLTHRLIKQNFMAGPD